MEGEGSVTHAQAQNYIAEITELQRGLEDMESANQALLREKEELLSHLSTAGSMSATPSLRDSVIGRGTCRLSPNGRQKDLRDSYREDHGEAGAADANLEDKLWLRAQRFRLLWQSAAQKTQLSVSKTKIVLLYGENTRLKAKFDASNKQNAALQASLREAKKFQEAQLAQLEQKKDIIKELKQKSEMDKASMEKEKAFLEEQLSCVSTFRPSSSLGLETETVLLKDRVGELEMRIDCGRTSVSSKAAQADLLSTCSELAQHVGGLQLQLQEEREWRSMSWWSRLQHNMCITKPSGAPSAELKPSIARSSVQSREASRRLADSVRLAIRASAMPEARDSRFPCASEMPEARDSRAHRASEMSEARASTVEPPATQQADSRAHHASEMPETRASTVEPPATQQADAGASTLSS